MGAAAKKRAQPKQASVIARNIPTKPRLVKNRQPAKEIAFERIYEFLWELGADDSHAIGWKIKAIEHAGLNPWTGYAIINGDRSAVSSDVVDQVSIATGVPVGVFYDEDV